MKVLFVWDQCGEEPLEFYIATGDAAHAALKCQGQYINSSDLDDDAAIYDFHTKYLGIDERGRDIPLPLGMEKLSDLDQAVGPFDRIVVAGFLA